MQCKCGCKGEAHWLMTGVDFDGTEFVDEPGCESVARYCQEAAGELRLPFSLKPIERPSENC